MSTVTLDSEVLNFIISTKGADKLKELAYLGVFLLQSEYESLEEKINNISTSLEIEENKVFEIAQGTYIIIIIIINMMTIYIIIYT